MKDSQLLFYRTQARVKYIKESNERFSTCVYMRVISISRRVMKDSQLTVGGHRLLTKYIKAN